MEIQLTELQRKIMAEFYACGPTKVIFDKKEREMLWKKATGRSRSINLKSLSKECPALAHQIEKSYESGKNIQSAVFSECVYSQTIANMFGLGLFVNYMSEPSLISPKVRALIEENHLIPRYIYSNEKGSRMLIQAGYKDGVDSVLVTVRPFGVEICGIEFKEPGAKTSEPDLPKYKEDGLLVSDEKWLRKNPQFRKMLKEQEGLNFFRMMGHNISDFSKESVIYAVSNNYETRHLEVICTEDINGRIVMMPANQVQLWADTKGEIRPSGRNHYKVWTPEALRGFLASKRASFSGDKVTIDKGELEVRRQRGGAGKMSGYKITPLFFVYAKDCTVRGNSVTFRISDVRQLKPTIAGKVFFNTLKYAEVKKYYGF